MALCFRLSLQGCLYSEPPWKIQFLPLEKRAGMLTDLEDRDHVLIWGTGQACLLPTAEDLGSFR